LRHARVERWGRGNSVIHRRHAAAKILVTLALLVSIASLTERTAASCALYLVLLVIAVAVARLPVPAMLLSACVVLPFAMCFAIVSALAGDPVRAIMLVVRGYLSALAALLLIATTPMPALIGGLEWLRAPEFLLQVMQFLYRYLIVLMEEASAMRQSAMARAASIRTLQFRRAAAAAGVLFARSSARAQAIHRAMVSRGFAGRIPAFRLVPFRQSDAAFLAISIILVTGLRAVFR
jgi:cobalt/nickel transport system permease protein